MVGVRRTLSVVAFGSALMARPAFCQQGSSVSLTHTVSVTVPPRVKVKVGNLASSTVVAPSRTPRSDGLTVSVNATQSWVLSIGSTHGGSRLQWSTERRDGLSAIGAEELVASGGISPVAAVATVFLRDGRAPHEVGSDMVTLTVVAP